MTFPLINERKSYSSCYIPSDYLEGTTREDLAYTLHFTRYQYHDELKTCAEKLGVDQAQIEHLELTCANSIDLPLAARMADMYNCKLYVELVLNRNSNNLW